MATVEHAALTLLVAAALGAGGAAVDARALPGAVGAQLQRAYCLVAGGDCLASGGPRPCVVARHSKDRVDDVGLKVVRLSDGRLVVRERRADGTVRVTVTLSDGAGAAWTLGAKLRLAGRRVAAELEVSGGMHAASTRSWTVADGAAADRLVERLAREDPRVGGGVRGIVSYLRDRGGDEDERGVAFSDVGEASGTLEALGLGAVGAAAGSLTSGVRVDRRTGERTLSLSLDRDLGGTLTAPLARLGGLLAAETGAELAVDRAGRPTTLTVRQTGDARGEGRLRGQAAAGGDLVEVEARLDLADPQLRALAERLLHGDVGAARALASHVEASARIDVRRYATTHGERSKGRALGPASYEERTTDDDARLVGAWGRDPGLDWSRRLDCGLAVA